MKLKLGQGVKVRKGVLCPDDLEFDISGWRGRIIDVSEDENGEMTIGIAWDSLTLKGMPERYIEKSETDGLDWTIIYLSPSDVELVKSRDSEKNTDKIRSELEKRFEWSGMGEEGKRIQAVVSSVKTNDDFELMTVWKKHLEQNLDFPFESIVDEFQSKGPFKQGDRLNVFGIESVDDLYGVIISCKAGRRRCSFPLADLAAVDGKS
ncbi:MAG: hypothetical protein GY737_10490, partial [Desulfobacteraceae bacterium]|nr:hypothetical protein [Desulfobacteraceae bacterium]